MSSHGCACDSCLAAVEQVHRAAQGQANVVVGATSEWRIDLGDDRVIFALVIYDQMDENLGAPVLDDADAGCDRAIFRDDDRLRSETDGQSFATVGGADAEVGAGGAGR